MTAIQVPVLPFSREVINIT